MQHPSKIKGFKIMEKLL